MKETIAILSRIQTELGGSEKCEVLIRASFDPYITIEVYWFDGSNYRVMKKFTIREIEDINEEDDLIRMFIAWAKHMKDSSTKQ